LCITAAVTSLTLPFPNFIPSENQNYQHPSIPPDFVMILSALEICYTDEAKQPFLAEHAYHSHPVRIGTKDRASLSNKHPLPMKRDLPMLFTAGLSISHPHQLAVLTYCHASALEDVVSFPSPTTPMQNETGPGSKNNRFPKYITVHQCHGEF